MRIIIFYEQFLWGGVDKHLLDLLNNWPNLTDKIIIITNRNNEGFHKIKSKLNKKIVKYVYFNSFSYSIIHNFIIKKKINFLSIFLSPLQPFFLILTTLKLFFFLKKFKKVDKLISINGAYPASWANICIIFVSKILKFKKRVMVVHHEASSARFFFKTYNYCIDKILSKCLTNLICVSKATFNTIKSKRSLNFEIFKTKIIHNEIITHKKDLDLKLFSKYKKKFFLFGILGRAEKYKGHEDVLYAISLINKKYRDRFKLLIIGDENKKNIIRLKDLSKELNIKDSLIFVGYVNYSSISIVNNLDSIIMATRDFEGFGYTALEAIKIGKPLITTDVGAIKEFVNNKYVEIIKPKNTKELGSSIVRILKKPKFYKKRAIIYKNKLKQKFEMSNNYRSVLD